MMFGKSDAVSMTERTTISLATATALLITPAALAQMASVPPPDANGNFMTALQPGHRGDVFPTRKWLVVDPDPTYLNCRSRPNGPVQLRVAPGAVLTAVFAEGNGDAIVFAAGQPWLRVTGTDPLMVGEPGMCYVRANARYIAPINEEAIQGGVFEDRVR